ncbi:hypothetical protein [Maridesulfovibrio frigidus]|uniref:hypothetical protein n=1 Tax=Maridesulfovibrio frigidus TaxID=340956 RepID=UPI0004E25F6F|nr:hypothetical protein [Maridesulfovibrio frigidus]
MTKGRDMRDVAAEYVEYFDFDFGDSGMTLTLAKEAPSEISTILKDLFGNSSQESLVKLYEALNIISEADDVFSCEVDEKVISLPLFCRVVRYLDETANK